MSVVRVMRECSCGSVVDGVIMVLRWCMIVCINSVGRKGR